MADIGKRLRVFISSPADVRPERLIAQRIVNRLDREYSAQFHIEPVLWEREPLVATEHFQTLITRPRETAIVVVILWSRLGVPLPTDKAGLVTGRPVTGTEWEFEDAVASYRASQQPQILLYRKKAEVSFSLTDRSEIQRRIEQIDRVDDFMRRWFHDETTGGSTAASWSFQTATEFEELLETHLRELFTRRADGAIPDSEIRWHQGSPFRSLQAFELEHASVFFGRTRARNELRELLAARSAQSCAFVLVLGASGSGKSSLVKAGLLPDLLLPGMIGKVALCRYAIFRPGDRPLDLVGGLAAAILASTALPELAELQYDAVSLTTTLQAASTQSALPIRQGLAKAAATGQLTQAAEARLLLIIDQLEEMFTHESVTASDREAFVGILAALARSGVVWVVATMRSDFFDRLDQSPALAQLSSGARYLLAPPDDTEIGQIVRQPARAAGLRFETDAYGSGLDDVIRKAASAQPGSLPLLEFTLDQLWQKRIPPGILTFTAYDALGGLEGALGQRAEQEFAALPRDVQAVLPSVLRSLVTVGQGARGVSTARPAPLARFPPESAQRRLVDAFLAAQARLLVAESDGAEPRVRIAHEALLTHWPRAARQIAADRVDLQLRARLEQAAAVWHTTPAKEQDGRLLSVGLPLSEAEDLLARRRDELDAEVVDYVERSTALAQQRQRAQRRRLRVVTAVFALLTLGAIVGAALAYRSRTLANERATALQDAVGNLLGAAAQRLLDPVDADTAPVVAALATEGWKLAHTADAWNAAQRLPVTGTVAIATSVRTVAFSPDDKLVLTGGEDDIVLIDASTGKELRRIAQHDVSSVAFSADGRVWAAGDRGGIVQLVDSMTGKEVTRIAHDGPVTALAFSPDGHLLATGSEDRIVRLIETEKWTVVRRISHGGAVRALAFSSDGGLLATGSDDRTACLIDTRGAREIARFGHDGPVLTVAISSDGKSLATGSEDHTARVFDTSSGKETMRFLHEGNVLSVAFSPDNRLIATGSEDFLARLIDRERGEVVSKFPHNREVCVVRFSPDGRKFATGSGDGLGRLVDVARNQELVRIKHEGPVQALAFSANGAFLVTGNPTWPPTFQAAVKITALTSDRSIARMANDGDKVLMFSPDSRTILALNRYGGGARLFDVGTGGRKSIPNDNNILAAALSPDGRLLATARWGGAARLIELPGGAEIARITGDGDELAYAFSPDGHFSATAHADGTVRVSDAATRRELWRIHVDATTQDVVFSPDARLLAILDDKYDVRLVESATGRDVSRLHDPNGAVNISPDGRRFYVNTGSSLIDTATGREIAPLAHDGWVLTSAFSPDGRLLATGGRDSLARVFDSTRGREIARTAHNGFVVGVAFSADSRTLASVDGETARLLDIRSGKEIVRIALQDGAGTVAFSPNGKLLITGNARDLRVWSLDFDNVFEQLCRQRGRNLSLPEWNRYVGNTPWHSTCDCWSTPADVIKAGLWPPKNRTPNCPAEAR
ncbi:MAG: AAA family ATPase [Thermoanaerobaculia bacterium]